MVSRDEPARGFDGQSVGSEDFEFDAFTEPSGSPRRRVRKSDLTERPYLLWNAFVDLVSIESYPTMTSIQREAHLVFWYDAEVQNGGHGQYLENRGNEQLEETVNALKTLGLPCQAQVLFELIAPMASCGKDSDWSEVVGDELLDSLDAVFHRCTPSVMDALEQHLTSNRHEYIELI